MHLLLADDDPSMQALLARLLEHYGAPHVSVVDNGRLALDALARRTFAGVVLDHEMPELDGLGAARAIRADPALAGLPIMIVSGHSASALVTEFVQLGIHEYLRKPVNPVVAGPRLEAFLRRCTEWHAARGAAREARTAGDTRTGTVQGGIADGVE